MPTVIRMMQYDREMIVEKTVANVSEIPPVSEDHILWVEFNGLRDLKALQALGEMFRLHPLALEDAVHMGQRPKVDQYDSNHYIVAEMIYFDDVKRLCSEQVSMFLGPGFLITIQEDDDNDVFEPVRERIRVGRGYIRKMGPDYLAYALLDSVIDHCFPILESLGEALEALEDDMLEQPTTKCVGKLHDYRRTLVSLRKALWPERDLVNSLLHDESGLISTETKVFLRDCYDHSVRIIELIESYREIAGGLLELYLTSVSMKTNEIMRVLTVISSIFIPLTFVAGVYGMNFDHMPELKQPAGYFVCIGVMLLIAILQLIWFRKKGWL